MAQISLVPKLMKQFPGFSPDAISFLRALKRNNRREWFQPRKEKYEALIKAPMLEMVAVLNEELIRFRPGLCNAAGEGRVSHLSGHALLARIKRLTRRTSPPSFRATARSSARAPAFFTCISRRRRCCAFAGVWRHQTATSLLAYRALLQRTPRASLQEILEQQDIAQSWWASITRRAAEPHAQGVSGRPSRGSATAAVSSGIWNPHLTSNC